MTNCNQTSEIAIQEVIQEVNVIIEIPKNSHIKYEYDKYNWKPRWRK